MNHQNLFDDIAVKRAEPGFALFRHGGGSEFFPLCGAFNTFWNIRLHFPQPAKLDPPVEILGSTLPAPEARLVGLSGNVPIEIKRYGPDPYMEGIGRPGIAVPSLYEYQLNKRMADAATERP